MVGIKLNELRMKCLRTETIVELTLKDGSVCNCISKLPEALFSFGLLKQILNILYIYYT